MTIEYCPRSQILGWLSIGWRLLPDVEYQPGDYAILMFKPEVSTEMPASVMRAVADRFQPVLTTRSNKSRGASSRMWQRSRKFAEVVA